MSGFDFASSDDEEEEVFEEEEEEAEEADEPMISGALTGSRSSLKKSYNALTASSAMTAQKNMIKEVVDVLALPESAARRLLLHFRWNKLKAVEKYIEDPETVRKEAEIDLPGVGRKAILSESILECSICLEEKPFAEMYSLETCPKHTFCHSCWKDTLQGAVEEGRGCVWTLCMQSGCKHLISDDAWEKFLTPDQFAKYREFSTLNFVDQNPNWKWCPSPGCHYAIQVDSKDRRKPVTCKCGFTFCFSCADAEIGSHEPCTCEEVTSWMEKSAKESSDVMWIMSQTKKCPKCHKPIQKNQGCPHMTCKKEAGGCGHEFCWYCRADYKQPDGSTHNTSECDARYRQAGGKDDEITATKEEELLKDKEIADVKTDLDLYVFHFHRFKSHRDDRSHAQAQLAIVDARVDGICKVHPAITGTDELRLLKEALGTLIRCKSFLTWSYVHGYYLAIAKETSLEADLNNYRTQILKFADTIGTLYETDPTFFKTEAELKKWKAELRDATAGAIKSLTSWFLYLEKVAEDPRYKGRILA